MKITVLFGLFFSLLLMTRLSSAEVTQYGAKITKAEMAATDAPVLTLPEGWKLLEGEKFTGVNIREYYFTIEKEGKDLEAPIVQADWPNVEIDAAYGVTDFERTETGCRFQMTKHRAPTQFGTLMPQIGAVQVHVSHNIEGLQAGPHRDKPYPKGEIAAQLNFMFASREMMKEAGFTQSADSIDALVNIYGFETNFPNGHSDYPPHFHIMTVWDSWKFIQCTHFILAPDGKILYNNQYVVENGKDAAEKCKNYQPGEEVEMTDKSGAVKMILSVLPDGSGVMMRLPDSETEYKISGDNPSKQVTFYVRANRSASWEEKSVIQVNDDPLSGVLSVETKRNGQTEQEVWNYNPHTGNLIESK